MNFSFLHHEAKVRATKDHAGLMHPEKPGK